MSQVSIVYDPLVPPGTEKPNGGGELIRYVEPEEYYVAMLGCRMNTALVFIAASTSGRVPAERLQSVDDAIARAYKEEYEECVLTHRVIGALAHASMGGHSGRLLVENLESARQAFYAAKTIDEAVDLHGAFRLQMLMQGAEGYLTDMQVSVGELLTDYLLVQRAIAEDIRRAEHSRKPGETRGQLLAKWDRSADVAFERIIGHVLRPQRLAEMIPKAQKMRVAQFAVRRKQIFRDGVFVHVLNANRSDTEGASW